MTTTIRKWGNSYAVRLPRESVLKLGLQEGQEMTVTESDKGRALSLVPVAASTVSLKKMVSRITKGNKHEVTDWGKPMGNEIW